MVIKKMKIKQKISLCFGLLILIIGVTGVVITLIIPDGLKSEVEKTVLQVAGKTLADIDKDIYLRGEGMAVYAENYSLAKIADTSNSEFARIPNVREFIKGWVEEKETPLIPAVLDYELSAYLSRYIEVYERRYGYSVFREMFVTNKYGAVIASSGMTTDFFQADEDWFRNSINSKDVRVDNVNFDKKLNTWVVDIVVNLFNESGELSGLFKGVLNLEDTRRSIDRVQLQSQYSSMVPYLVDKKGFVIFSGGNQHGDGSEGSAELNGSGDDISLRKSVIFASIGEDGFVTSKANGKKLMSCYVSSKGFKGFNGAGWSLIIDYETKDVYGAVFKLRNIVIVVFSIAFISAIVLSLVNAGSIVAPILKLRDAAGRISIGGQDAKLEVTTGDEIGELAASFNGMTENIQMIAVSKDYVESIIDSSNDMIITVNTNLKIVEFNKSAQVVFGYTKEEVSGKEVAMLYADPSRVGYIQSEIDEKGCFTKRIENRRKNGEIFTSFVSVSVLKDSGGNVIGSVCVSRDITGIKQKEDELRSAMEKAVAGSRVKDEFLATMSNEIRTPLNGIVGMADLIMDSMLDNNQINLARTLTSEASALSCIINNMLDYSKIEAEKFEVENIPFDPRTIFNDICNGFVYITLENKVFLSTSLSSDVPSRLTGDPGRLRQVLVNLITHAIKFTEKGEIVIAGTLVEDREGKVKILFSVKYTGTGIPEEKQSVLIDSFTQVEGSTSNKYGGTGLGVAIAKQLVSLMGGELNLKSSEGVGSEFLFPVIFGKQEVNLNAVKGDCNLEISNLKVLIVDENQINQYVLSEYLNSLGCITVKAYGGKDAMAILENADSLKEPFDVILLDFRMVDIDGFELASKIRKRSAFNDVPIIMQTSFGESGDAKKCREMGIQGYLSKPVRMDYFKHAIINVLNFSKNKSGGDIVYPLVTRHTITEDGTVPDIQILVAEDYPTNQYVFIRYFQSAGFNIEIAENGREAVNVYKEKHHDLIFMDVQMPEMDGYRAAINIRQYEEELLKTGHQPQTKAVIVAMTAYATQMDKDKCFESGMNDFIAKPLRRKELLLLTGKWIKEINYSKLTGSFKTVDADITPPDSGAKQVAMEDVPVDIAGGNI